MTKRALLVWLTLCELFLSTFSGKLYKIYLEIKRNTQWKKNFNEHMTSWHQLLLKKLASQLFPRCVSWRISLTYLQCNIWPFYTSTEQCELFLKWHFCSLNQSSLSFQYNVLQTCITDWSLHLCLSAMGSWKNAGKRNQKTDLNSAIFVDSWKLWSRSKRPVKEKTQHEVMHRGKLNSLSGFFLLNYWHVEKLKK